MDQPNPSLEAAPPIAPPTQTKRRALSVKTSVRLFAYPLVITALCFVAYIPLAFVLVAMPMLLLVVVALYAGLALVSLYRTVYASLQLFITEDATKPSTALTIILSALTTAYAGYLVMALRQAAAP